MLLYDQNTDLSKFLKTNYNKELIFSLEEIKLNFRLSKFREALKAKNMEAALICKPENIRYLSRFTGSSGYVLITAKEACLITDFRYIEQAKQECVDYDN